MFKNYLKITIRNAFKHKSYTLINILGLAIGMACFMLFMRYIQEELSYDAFHENADRVFRFAVESDTPQGKRYSASTPYPVAPALREAYPEIAKIVRIYAYGEPLIEANAKKIYDEKFVFAEPEFFEIFSFPLQRGNPATALTAPNSVVLTQSTATKYFGDGDPLGKTLRFEDKIDFTVTGVVADPPTNSHFHFNFLASFHNVDREVVGFDPNQWGAFFGVYTYGLFSHAVSVAEIEEKLRPFYDRHAGAESSEPRRLLLQPIKSIHLHSHFESEIEPNNSVRNLWVLGTIGFLVLLIACINFINLTTARSVRRGREVGVCKVLGAARLELIKQYLGESIALSLVALILGLGLAELMLPIFSGLLDKQIGFDFGENLGSMMALAGLTLVIGGLAGIYPAFVLSGFQPVESLKGATKNPASMSHPFRFRKILVVTQFAIFVALMAATIVMREQMQFIKAADLGFEKELIVVIPLQDRSVSKQYQTLKNELLRCQGVRAVTASFKSPIGKNEFGTSLYPKGPSEQQKIDVLLNFIDFDFLEMFGVELLAGRNFSPEFTSDSARAFIINQAAMKELGITDPHQAIGRKATIGVNEIEGTIIGVTEDFHVQSLHQAIAPHVMMHWPFFFNVLSVRIESHGIAATLAQLEETWQRTIPQFPFQYRFLDEYIAGLYEAEAKIERTLQIFSLLTILVACLGLFGLASFAAEQRTKEVGIRKVLGATVTNVTALLSKDFVKLVLLANLIAWPIAYLAMNKWLQNFAYRIEMSWWVFALAGGLALVIALATVSTQAIRAALANPVDSLRYE
jgi:putative ABC transport system permease protein